MQPQARRRLRPYGRYHRMHPPLPRPSDQSAEHDRPQAEGGVRRVTVDHVLHGLGVPGFRVKRSQTA